MGILIQADFQARIAHGEFCAPNFGVTDDAEWTLISERITKVFELRRGAGGFGGFGGRNNRAAGGAAADPAQDALKSALTDKLPDAEVKARLDRVREVHKAKTRSEAGPGPGRTPLRALRPPGSRGRHVRIVELKPALAPPPYARRS